MSHPSLRTALAAILLVTAGAALTATPAHADIDKTCLDNTKLNFWNGESNDVNGKYTFTYHVDITNTSQKTIEYTAGFYYSDTPPMQTTLGNPPATWSTLPVGGFKSIVTGTLQSTSPTGGINLVTQQGQFILHCKIGS